MTDHNTEHHSRHSLGRIRSGILWFLIFSVIGIAVSIWWKRPANIKSFLVYLKGAPLIFLGPLVLTDFLLGGLRYRLFFNGKTLQKVSLWDCMRANWANMFMGAITPFQTGGGPAQFYILYRSGVKASQAALVILINLAATLLLFQYAAITAVILLPSNLFGNDFAPILRTGLLAVSGICGLVLLILVFPTTGLALIRSLLQLIPGRLVKFCALRKRMLDTLSAEVHQFRNDIRLVSRNRMIVLCVLLATVALYFNKYLTGYILARSLHQDVPFLIFIGLQSIQSILIYFAPTPGASGIAELSSTWLMKPIMSTEILVFYAIAWRFFTTVIGAFVGGLVLLFDVRLRIKGSLSSAV